MSQDSFTLVVAEVAHVQSYIFGSNRLKENVGASSLVVSATQDWAYETLDPQNLRTNLKEDYLLEESPFNDLHIEDGNLHAEVLYGGGGNFVGLFRSEDQARKFITSLSETVLCRAPNLHFVCHHESFNWNGDIPLSKAVAHALGELKAQRSFQPTQWGLGGLGVTQVCASTQLPAVWMDKQPSDNGIASWDTVSAEVIAKRQYAEKANERLRKDLLDAKDLPDAKNYDFPLQLDSLGRTKGDTSQMAVVHADGNGMGKIITDIFSKIIDNRAYINMMRGFSEKVKTLAQDAQKHMLDRVLNAIEQDKKGVYIQHSQQHSDRKIYLDHKSNNTYFLPIRPLISGGDDVSFACDARLAFALSETLIEAFEHESEPIMTWLKQAVDALDQTFHDDVSIPDRLTACAGIAVVNVHYPFARAYQLAEDLCQSGKRALHEHGLDTGAIDWYQATGGLYADLDEMRERETLTESCHSLTLRPVFHGLDRQVEDKTFRTWAFVKQTVTEFQDHWSDHRSKAHDLAIALREGADATQVYQERYLTVDSSQSYPDGPPHLPEDRRYHFHHHGGWLIDDTSVCKNEAESRPMHYCGYYDGLDLMDIYYPLEQIAQEELTHG